MHDDLMASGPGSMALERCLWIAFRTMNPRSRSVGLSRTSRRGPMRYLECVLCYHESTAWHRSKKVPKRVREWWDDHVIGHLRLVREACSEAELEDRCRLLAMIHEGYPVRFAGIMGLLSGDLVRMSAGEPALATAARLEGMVLEVEAVMGLEALCDLMSP